MAPPSRRGAASQTSPPSPSPSPPRRGGQAIEGMVQRIERRERERDQSVYRADSPLEIACMLREWAAEGAPRPGVRLVSREDLATVIEAAQREHAHMLHEVEVCDAGFRGNARDIEKRAAELGAAIDRLRAGEEK